MNLDFEKTKKSNLSTFPFPFSENLTQKVSTIFELIRKRLVFFNKFQSDIISQDLRKNPEFQQQMSKEIKKSACLRSQIMIFISSFFLILFSIVGATGEFPKALYKILRPVRVWFEKMLDENSDLRKNL